MYRDIRWAHDTQQKLFAGYEGGEDAMEAVMNSAISWKHFRKVILVPFNYPGVPRSSRELARP